MVRSHERELKKLDDQVSAMSGDLAYALKIEEGAFILIDTFFSYFEPVSVEEVGSGKMIAFWTWHRRCLMLDALLPQITVSIEQMQASIDALEDKRSRLLNVPRMRYVKEIDDEGYLGQPKYYGQR